MILVLMGRVDFGFDPSKDPKLIVGPEINNGESDLTRPGFPGGRVREKEVANEVGRFRVGW